MTSQELTIYHNPSCSKSRETLQILEYHKFLPRIIEYLDTPPSALEISEIVKKLGLAPIDLLRTTEKAYIDAKYQADLMTDQEIIEAIVKHPSLLQRPIVICGNKAIIGRPPATVMDIISTKLAQT
jgi:arsenate reductase|tara:strand:- start:1022 stop:1399 length:378 start_codon:yes stop_codon:yes gene_type:complete